MAIAQTFLLATALSVDAFTVATCVAVSSKFNLKKNLFLSSIFALVQGSLFSFGFALGDFGTKFALEVFPWVGLILLSLLGFKAIKDGLSKSQETSNLELKGIIAIFLLAISVSIDALVAGIPYPIISKEGLQNFIIITATTFLITFIGIRVASRIKNKSTLSIIAGITLIAIGLSFLL